MYRLRQIPGAFSIPIEVLIFLSHILTGTAILDVFSSAGVSSKFYPSFLENLHCISAVSLSIISTSILPVLVASHVFGHYQFPFAFLSRVLVVVSSRSCVAFPLSAFPFPTISRRRESRCRWPGAVGDMRRCWSSGDLVMFRCGCRWCGLWVMSALGCGCWQQRQPAQRQSRLTDSCSVAVRRQRDRQPLLVSLTLSCYFVLSLVICVTVDVIVGVVVFIVFHLSSRLKWKHYVFGLSIRLCVPSGGILRLACRRLLMKSNWLLLFSLFFYYCWLDGRKGIRPVKNWVEGCWRGYPSGARCRLAYGPADATATHCLLLH